MYVDKNRKAYSFQNNVMSAWYAIVQIYMSIMQYYDNRGDLALLFYKYNRIVV